MSRALATQAVSFPPERRDEVLGGLRGRRDVLKEHGCNYWLFEDPGLPGLMIEFLEARDADTLRTAREHVDGMRADTPILSEVEL
jgi:hypothetical protein